MASEAHMEMVGSEDISDIKEKIRCQEGLFMTPDLLLDTHKLPQLVKVTYAECEAPGLSKNEILLLHFTYTSKKVMAQSLSTEGGVVVGPELSIPLAYPGRFELLQNQRNVKVFESLGEVVKEDVYSQAPVVRLLVEEDVLTSELSPEGFASPEMGSATISSPMLMCKKGDVLTILSAQPRETPVQQLQEIPDAQKRGFGQKLKGKFMGKGKRTSQLDKKVSEEQRSNLIFTCSNQDGEIVSVPGDLKGRFTLKPLEFESGTTYTVENIIDNFKVPQDVKLVQGDCPGDDDEFTGYVRLFHSYRDEVIVGTSVQNDGQISQVEFSINTDIQFSPADLELSENKDILRLFQSNVRTSVLVDSKNMDSFILVMGKPYSSVYQDRTNFFKPSDLATYTKAEEVTPTNPIYEETPDVYQDPDLCTVVPSAPPQEPSNTAVEYYSPVSPPPDSIKPAIKPDREPRRGKTPPTAIPTGFMGELKKVQESKKTKPPVPPRTKGSVKAAKPTSDRRTSDDYTDLTDDNYTSLAPITESTVKTPTAFVAFENTVYDTLTLEEGQPVPGKRQSASVKDLIQRIESPGKSDESVSYKTPLNIRLELPKEPEEDESARPLHLSSDPGKEGETKAESEYQSPPSVPVRSPNVAERRADDRKSPLKLVLQMPLKPSATGGVPHARSVKGGDDKDQELSISFGEQTEANTDYVYPKVPTMTVPQAVDVHGQSEDSSTWVPPDDLSTLSVSEVTACLRHLNLGNDVIAAFQRELIDGALLNDLDEAIMTQDMNLRKLDALKILKFIGGWRP